MQGTEFSRQSDTGSCEFCDEFAGRGGAFSSLYVNVLSERIVARRDGFVAFPTIGQLFPRYLLVAPIAHVERFASLSMADAQRLSAFVDELEAKVAHGNPVAVFEHGATRKFGGGCGIYHAHIHVVPLPREVTADELLPGEAIRYGCLVDALVAARKADEYLLYRCGSDVSLLNVSARLAEFPSQYFRRVLASKFGKQDQWDWRAIAGPEIALVDTVVSLAG